MNKQRFKPRRNFGRKFPQKVMRTSELLEAIRATNAVNEAKLSEPEEIYSPTHKFEDFHISPEVIKNIADKGYAAPTPIQDKIIPSIIEGRDVIGIANTGTGK